MARTSVRFLAVAALTVAASIAACPAHGADAGKACALKGIQVDVQTFGPITCSTMIPPENLAMYGYNTTCSVTKGTSVAAVEVTVKSKGDMVPVERLKPIAEKMAGRL